MKKYIWTFWTDYVPEEHNLWNLICFNLSVELVKKFSNNICIYTDSKGAKILQSKNLDYPIEVIDFNISKSFYPKFSEAKLRVMSMQNQPFCHIDHDVFLFQQPQSFPEFDIVVQSLEKYKNFPMIYFLAYYNDGNINVKFPEEVIKCAKENEFAGYNCGYVDVNNLEVCQEWCKEGLKISEQYDPRFKFSNIIPEQFCLYALAKHRGYKIKELFEHDDIIKDGAVNTSGYWHIMGAKDIHYDDILNRLIYLTQNITPEFYKKLSIDELNSLKSISQFEDNNNFFEQENYRIIQLGEKLAKRYPNQTPSQDP